MLTLSIAMNIPLPYTKQRKYAMHALCCAVFQPLQKPMSSKLSHDPELLNEERQRLCYPSQNMPSRSRTEYKMLWFAVGYWYVLSIGPGAVVIGALGLLDEPTLMLPAERFGFMFVNPCGTM